MRACARAAARERARELLDMVQIPSAQRRLDAYPHELSGGLRQRAMIALALSCRPKLLLADEPTTALDATVQIQILLLIREVQRALGMAVILVTHDIGVACEIADDVAVMYAGRFVETAGIADIVGSPRHPYTKGLLASTIDTGSRGTTLTPIPGSPPDPANLPAGCAFAPRCVQRLEICGDIAPTMIELDRDPQSPLPPVRAGELVDAEVATLCHSMIAMHSISILNPKLNCAPHTVSAGCLSGKNFRRTSLTF